jgi:hypothetical protein
MARSTYIWVVFNGLRMIGTFTVKHEMITWLAKQPTQSRKRLSVVRMPDGNPYDAFACR